MSRSKSGPLFSVAANGRGSVVSKYVADGSGFELAENGCGRAMCMCVWMYERANFSGAKLFSTWHVSSLSAIVPLDYE